MNWFAKKVFDGGGGGNLKNRYKSHYYLSKIFKNLKRFIEQFSRFLTLRHEDKLLSRKGSILIEFAVCMPVLIILLFYIHDLVKLKRYHSQTEFIGQQIANILQNISQKRSNKAINLTNIKHACTPAWLTIPPGSSILRSCRHKILPQTAKHLI